MDSLYERDLIDQAEELALLREEDEAMSDAWLDSLAGCLGCKRPLRTDDHGIITCVNSRCIYYSPGVHGTSLPEAVRMVGA